MDICIMIQLNMNIMVHLKDFSQPRLPLIDQAINTDIIHAVGNYIGETPVHNILYICRNLFYFYIYCIHFFDVVVCSLLQRK